MKSLAVLIAAGALFVAAPLAMADVSGPPLPGNATATVLLLADEPSAVAPESSQGEDGGGSDDGGGTNDGGASDSGSQPGATTTSP